MGIVQRFDENGNPINIFGVRVNEPTINRFTAAMKCNECGIASRTRSCFRRLRRCSSLQSGESGCEIYPDTRPRRSAVVGASLVRDTRERCERGLLPNRRDPEEAAGRSRRDPFRLTGDATRGSFSVLIMRWRCDSWVAIVLQPLPNNLSHVLQTEQLQHQLA
jgi:hypothetical protein